MSWPGDVPPCVGAGRRRQRERLQGGPTGVRLAFDPWWPAPHTGRTTKVYDSVIPVTTVFTLRPCHAVSVHCAASDNPESIMHATPIFTLARPHAGRVPATGRADGARAVGTRRRDRRRAAATLADLRHDKAFGTAAQALHHAGRRHRAPPAQGRLHRRRRGRRGRADGAGPQRHLEQSGVLRDRLRLLRPAGRR